MLRKITKQVGRFQVGGQHDYPRAVWNKVAGDAKLPLDKFTELVEVNPVHQSSTKGRPRIHVRLGATK